MIIQKTPYSLTIKRGRTGLGLFTNNSIRKGRFVIEYGGDLLPTKEADRRGGKFLFKINKDWAVDGKSRKNIARYMNHSCRPNCEDKIKKKRKRIFIYSKKNIRAGEELSFDYGKEYFDEYIKPKGCKCITCLEKKTRNTRHYHIKANRSYKKSA
ncbi:MAG: SET domain-containing protein [bacterium]|nr:SET domain-containing protein [bacterium]